MGSIGEIAQRLLVEMVVVSMGDEDVFRLRHILEIEIERGEILDGPEKAEKNRVHQDVGVDVLNHDRGVCDEGDVQSSMICDLIPVDPDREDLFILVKLFEFVSGKELPAEHLAEIPVML